MYQNETIWCTQKAMAQLFDCSTDNISLHLKNIYESGELEQEATSEFFSVVQTEGERQVNRKLKFYNLEATGDAVLNDAGKVTAEFAKSFAETEFEKYRVIQDRLFQSDFDHFNDDNLLPLDIE